MAGVDPIPNVAAGLPNAQNLGGGGGLGNRVNAEVLATVLQAQSAAMKQLLTSLGIGSQLNVTI